MAKKSKGQIQDFTVPVNSPTDYYFAGVPYKLPDDEELQFRANFRELTDDIKNGAGWLYRNSLKGSPYDNPLFGDKWTNYKFFTAPDGRVWYAANDNWNGELPAGYKEIAYKDVRRMLPKRDYFGGATAEEVRLRAVRQIPGLWEKVRERAVEYGVDPNLLLRRLMREGYIDQVVDRYNYGVPVAEQNGYWDSLWDEENLSGFNSFGLDDAATLLNEGKFSLRDLESSWSESENMNEKGRVVHSADPANLSSAIDIMAAQLGYNQGGVNRLYKPSKENLGTWTNASYNMGLYNDKLKDSSYVTGKYSYPDYYGKYGDPPRQRNIMIDPESGIGVIAPGNKQNGNEPTILLSQPWSNKKSIGGLIDRYGADAVRNALNAYRSGGGIHIKDSKKGTFTAAAKEHGKSVQAFASQVLANKDNYSPAMVKKANFARNAAKWHADGGLLKSFNGGGSTDGYVIAPDSQWRLPVSGRPAVTPPLVLEGELEPAVVSAERVIRPSVLPANPLKAVAASRDATAVPVIDLNIEPEPQLSFADYAKVAGALGENKERLINEQVNNLKSGEELKEFQKMLLAGGYYRNLPTPAIKAKTKDEIIALQEKLIDAGYDLGEYGADGTIGKYTRAAWRQYVKDHPDEAMIEAVADGLIGRNTREAARRYYEDITKVPDAVVMNSETEMPGLSRAMYNNIGKLEKVSNMLGTVLPAHVGAYVNKRENQRTGKRLGIEDYDGYLADTVEETLSSLNDALRSGNGEEVQRLRDSLRVQRDRLPLNRGNNLFLSNAEKQAVAAILTSLNGDRQMTYDDYLANLALLGKDDGAFLASNPRHRDASGKDVLLYGGRSGYHVMNDFEDERSDAGRDWHIVDGEGRVANILNAENRIFHEPMRGRLGAFSYYIDKDGNIHVQDRLEATEKQAARGKNDDSQYNGARDFFPRASTAPISGVITAKEYERFIRKARKKQTKGE